MKLCSVCIEKSDKNYVEKTMDLGICDQCKQILIIAEVEEND